MQLFNVRLLVTVTAHNMKLFRSLKNDMTGNLIKFNAICVFRSNVKVELPHSITIRVWMCTCMCMRISMEGWRYLTHTHMHIYFRVERIPASLKYDSIVRAFPAMCQRCLAVNGRADGVRSTRTRPALVQFRFAPEWINGMGWCHPVAFLHR